MSKYLPRSSRLTERSRNDHEDRIQPGKRSQTESRHHYREWQYSCGLCQEDHALRTCPRFRQLTPYRRYETVERRGYCRNCLARSHLAPDCPTITGCHTCNRRHHTLLHGAQQLEETHLFTNNDEPSFRRASVFIPTATIKIAYDLEDRWVSLRALICPSITSSRVSNVCVRRLGLPTFHLRGHLFAKLRMKSHHERRVWILPVTAMVTSELPRRPYSDPIIDDPTTDLCRNAIADLDPRGNDPIDVELGAEVYHAIRREAAIKTEVGHVEAFKTALGYIFIGPCNGD